MTRFIWSVLAIFGLVVIGCGQPSTEGQTTEVITPVAPEKFQQKWLEMKDSARLVDVRTTGEYKTGHIPKAELIDFLQEDFKQKISALDRNKPVLVYCRSGNRSDRAAEQMKEMGFQQIITLTGGILAWEKEGLPVEKSIR